MPLLKRLLPVQVAEPPSPPDPPSDPQPAESQVGSPSAADDRPGELEPTSAAEDAPTAETSESAQAGEARDEPDAAATPIEDRTEAEQAEQGAAPEPVAEEAGTAEEGAAPEPVAEETEPAEEGGGRRAVGRHERLMSPLPSLLLSRGLVALGMALLAIGTGWLRGDLTTGVELGLQFGVFSFAVATWSALAERRRVARIAEASGRQLPGLLDAPEPERWVEPTERNLAAEKTEPADGDQRAQPSRSRAMPLRT